MSEIETSFIDLGLKTPIINALIDLGYKKPSPIQAACIPHLLAGRDVLGLAQTGSGKTAAFSLPLLHNINLELKLPQALILTPTRELAIQVRKACANFAKYMKIINVVTLYGGQRYDVQLRALRQGPQVIVGTPGRLLDHLKRGTLDLSNISKLVIDEADEMLRMGFIEDVENILAQIPKQHQTALFSATMPEIIRCITQRFMNKPKEVRIQSNINTRPDINQSYWMVYGIHKNEALIRFLEVEDFDAAIIFVRTKSTTLEVAKVLEQNGYSSAAMNGDMNQTLREQTLDRLKEGQLDILIATDVAARGLDVDRISLVINYDIPMDSKSYIHRIGRTGRAGRAGRALLFVENYERRLLRNIERIMKLNIPEVELPNVEMLSNRRLNKFASRIQKQLKSSDLDMYKAILIKLQVSEKLNMETLAVALLKIAQGERPLILPPDPIIIKHHAYGKFRNCNKLRDNKSTEYLSLHREHHNLRTINLYRINIGRNDGVEIRHIINTIADKAHIKKRYIGNIQLFASYSTIELLKNIPKEILSNFTNTRILNKEVNVRLIGKTKPRHDEHRRNSSNYRFNVRHVSASNNNNGLNHIN